MQTHFAAPTGTIELDVTAEIIIGAIPSSVAKRPNAPETTTVPTFTRAETNDACLLAIALRLLSVPLTITEQLAGAPPDTWEILA